MRVRLTEIRLRPNGKKVRLDRDVEVESLFIGRGPDNDLCLKGLTVSLHHATVRIGDGRPYIEAASGTEVRVNGVPTTANRLAVSDEVRVGPWQLRLLSPEGNEDLRIEYEQGEPVVDTREALDARTALRIERGFFSRRPLAWSAIGVVLVGFLAFPLAFPTAQPLWTTGEVSSGHALLENDCAACHAGLFQPVANDACTSCHADVRRHAPSELGMVALEEARCVSCHLEHRGRELPVAENSEGACVDCHADLSRALESAAIVDASDFENDHPPIKLALVVDADAPPERMAWSSDLEERSGLEFNHSLHVDVDGEALDCADCHTREADGVSMAPIDFDSHCRECHELDSGDPALAGDIIHGPAARIRTQLRDHYTGRVLAGRVEGPDAPMGLLRRGSGPLSGSDERAAAVQWIRERVSEGESTLFEGVEEPDDAGGYCGLCHGARGGGISPATGEREPRAVAPVHLVRDWIEHARFPHADHGTQACADCHPGAAGVEGGLEASEEAGDVLIPGIDTCRECHVSKARGRRARVVSPCSTCHPFHDHRLERMIDVPSELAHETAQDGAHFVAPPWRRMWVENGVDELEQIRLAEYGD